MRYIIGHHFSETNNRFCPKLLGFCMKRYFPFYNCLKFDVIVMLLALGASLHTCELPTTIGPPNSKGPN
jgi:hypothetical protein